MVASGPPPNPRLVRIRDFSDRVPKPIAVGAVLLLLCLAAWIDWRPLGSRIAFPLYYLIPLCALAWFAGWLPALVATIASCILSVAGVSLGALPGGIPLVPVLGRILTFGLTLACARASAVGRLMLTFFLLGDQVRARTVPIRIGLRRAPEAGHGPNRGGRLPGRTSWHNDLLIRPGPSFGTGAHSTTKMCLRLMEDLVEPGQVVFDLGSGSGILSIAAAKLGASAVVAADTDPRAEQATRANIESNQVEDTVQFRRGSWPVFLEPPLGQPSRPGRLRASSLSAGEVPRADLLVANILTSVHVEVLREGLARCVRPGGKLILSGIRFDGWSQMQKAIEAAGLAVVEKRQMDVWLAVVAERPAEPPLADPNGRDSASVPTGHS